MLCKRLIQFSIAHRTTHVTDVVARRHSSYGLWPVEYATAWHGRDGGLRWPSDQLALRYEPARDRNSLIVRQDYQARPQPVCHRYALLISFEPPAAIEKDLLSCHQLRQRLSVSLRRRLTARPYSLTSTVVAAVD